MLSRHVVHLGILKWMRMRQSSPSILKLDQKFKSFKEFESQLKHYQDAKFIQMYRRSSYKIESTKTKQTITNNDLVVDLPTKILDENINLHRIKKINSRL